MALCLATFPLEKQWPAFQNHTSQHKCKPNAQFSGKHALVSKSYPCNRKWDIDISRPFTDCFIHQLSLYPIIINLLFLLICRLNFLNWHRKGLIKNYQFMYSVNFRSPEFVCLSHAGTIILEGVYNSSSNINYINRLNPAKR